MAVPKKRTGKSAQAKRRANWKATVPMTTTCKNCNAIVLTHTVCPECGYYKQAAVSIKDENYVAPDALAQKKEKKAPAKKAATKTKKAAEEAKAIETVAEVVEAAEEVKAEASETVEEKTEETKED